MAKMSPKVEIGGGGKCLVASQQDCIRTFEVVYLCSKLSCSNGDRYRGVKYYFWQEIAGARLGSWVMKNLYGIIMRGRYRIRILKLGEKFKRGTRHVRFGHSPKKEKQWWIKKFPNTNWFTI
jgi:hypothetical protein